MGYGEIAEAKSERVGTAAALEELGELQLYDVEPGVEETTDIEGAAGHAGSVSFGDGDAPIGGISGFDGGDGGSVEGAWIVEQEATMEGSEADVEVVEARIDEVERGDGDVPSLGYMAVRGPAGTNAVCSEEVGAGVMEDDIAFTFKGGLARRFPEQEALAGEPATEVDAFGAALAGLKAGDRSDAVVDEGAVGDEGHVWAAGFGMQEAYVSDAAKDVVQTLPLGEGEVA